MAIISLTLYTNSVFDLVPMSPIQMGLLSVNNLETNISRLGTFNPFITFSSFTGPCYVQTLFSLNCL